MATGTTHSNSSCAQRPRALARNCSTSLSRKGSSTAASRAAYSSCAAESAPPQSLTCCDLSISSIEVARDDRAEAVAVFLLAGGDDLTGEERVEESAALDAFGAAAVAAVRARVVLAAQLDAEVQAQPLRVELRVVRDLDGRLRVEQAAQRFERFMARRVAVAGREREEVEDVDGVGRGELHEAQAPRVRVERGRLGVEPEDGLLRQVLRRRGQFFVRRDQLVVELCHRIDRMMNVLLSVRCKLTPKRSDVITRRRRAPREG